MSPATTTVPRSRILFPPAIATTIALAINGFVPLVSPLLLALVIGAVVANTRLHDLRAMASQGTVTKLLLRLGVVLLGLKLSISELVSMGPAAVGVIAFTVVATYLVTTRVGDAMGMDRRLVSLIAAGFSICGAAAIAAVDDVVHARERDVGLAIALVTVFGSTMIVCVPWLATLLGLTEAQGALWAGASIHEVAQVVAAASLVGGGAIAVALTVKLGRVVLLAPAYAVVSMRMGKHDGGRAPLVPWFVIAFALAVALRSSVHLPGSVLDFSSWLTTALLAAAMFGLGLGIRVRELWPLPMRAFLLATISTTTAGGVSLATILVFT